ncbi:MAG: hypothetical protein JWQ76_5803 [Ramlibacter sp.]|nr:hypothetical protein [Ramlibacter sp.]
MARRIRWRRCRFARKAAELASKAKHRPRHQPTPHQPAQPDPTTPSSPYLRQLPPSYSSCGPGGRGFESPRSPSLRSPARRGASSFSGPGKNAAKRTPVQALVPLFGDIAVDGRGFVRSPRQMQTSFPAVRDLLKGPVPERGPRAVRFPFRLGGVRAPRSTEEQPPRRRFRSPSYRVRSSAAGRCSRPRIPSLR